MVFLGGPKAIPDHVIHALSAAFVYGAHGATLLVLVPIGIVKDTGHPGLHQGIVLCQPLLLESAYNGSPRAILIEYLLGLYVANVDGQLLVTIRAIAHQCLIEELVQSDVRGD